METEGPKSKGARLPNDDTAKAGNVVQEPWPERAMPSVLHKPTQNLCTLLACLAAECYPPSLSVPQFPHLCPRTGSKQEVPLLCMRNPSLTATLSKWFQGLQAWATLFHIGPLIPLSFSILCASGLEYLPCRTISNGRLEAGQLFSMLPSAHTHFCPSWEPWPFDFSHGFLAGGFP